MSRLWILLLWLYLDLVYSLLLMGISYNAFWLHRKVINRLLPFLICALSVFSEPASSYQAPILLMELITLAAYEAFHRGVHTGQPPHNGLQA